MSRQCAVIAAGGAGKRLGPIAIKPLVPIYDKPAIFSAIEVAISSGARDILIVIAPGEELFYQRAVGDGSNYGVSISYAVQTEQRGIGDVLIVAEDFIDKRDFLFLLGDNIFHGDTFSRILKEPIETGTASVFARQVPDPERFGVVEFDASMKALSIEEKPSQPKSSYAVVGIYNLPNDAVAIAKETAPSARGEIEITTVLEKLLNQGRLSVKVMPPNTFWGDIGTHDALYEASSYVRSYQGTIGLPVSSPEVAAFLQGFITEEVFLRAAATYEKSGYGDLLKNALKRNSI